MMLSIAITAIGIFPFYFGLLTVLRKQYDTRYGRLLRIFFVAGLTVVPFFSLQYFGVSKELLNALFGPFYAIIILAFSEEIVKSLALFFDKDLKKHYYYPIVIGLSFAFFENISYFLGFDFTVTLIVIATIRLFTVSTSHAVFTSLVAHFMNKGTRKTKTLYYILGIVLAGSTHSLFNLLNHWELSYLVIPFLILLIVFLHFDEPQTQHSHKAITPRLLATHSPLRSR